MTHWNTVPKALGDLSYSWLTPDEVRAAWLACRDWQRFVPAWSAISSSSELHMCDLGLVRHVVLNGFDWKGGAEDWTCIARWANLRAFDCADWWNSMESRNEIEQTWAAEALRDKTIETLTIGDARRAYAWKGIISAETWYP